MAAVLRRALDLDVELVEGHYGEFTLLIDGDEVISGGRSASLACLAVPAAVAEID